MMTKTIKLFLIGCAVSFAGGCSNSDNSAATAGTTDSSGIGHEKGKGTPYRGDSAVKGIQSDTVTNK